MHKPKCPKCKGNNYAFKKTKSRISWKCSDCGFKKVNKSAEQLLKEDPLSGKLKSDVNKIEEKFEEKENQKDIIKNITAKYVVDELKKKDNKIKVIKKKEGYYRIERNGEKQASIQDRKKWIAIYKKSNKFMAIKITNEKEIKEAINDI